MSQLRNSEILIDILAVAKKCKVAVADLTWDDYDAHGSYNPSTATRRFGSWTAAKKAASKANLSKLVAEVKQVKQDAAKEQKKNDILAAYLAAAKAAGESPTTAELVQHGVSRDSVARAFGSMAALDELARQQAPDIFGDVHIHTLFNTGTFSALRDTIRTCKRFVITTAVNGCKVHKPFLASLKVYCAANDAELLIMVASDPTHNRDRGNKDAARVSERYGTIDKDLAGEHIILQDTQLNSNLKISTIKTSAKQINPTTGMDRIAQRNGSTIMASPKQFQYPVAVSNLKLPHMVLTTGAVTRSDYSTDNYMSERLAYFADHDHQIGALVVEIEDDEMFHYRQIQAAEDGTFYEIARGVAAKYTPNGSKTAKASDLVLGDWHSGETDLVVATQWKKLAGIIDPNHILIHDGFNGLSVNPHEDEDTVMKTQRAIAQQLDLESEVRQYAADLDDLSKYARKSLVIVKSNHDEFLNRYIKKAKYVDDPHNQKMALQCALAMIDGLDPLQYAIEELVGLDAKTNVRWLKRNEDFKTAGIQLGAHGDKGPDGAKGNLALMEKSYGLSVTGHSHKPMILRGAWSVGTSSYLKLNYNEDSPSSWINASCIVWPNGQRQLVNVILGKMLLLDDAA